MNIISARFIVGLTGGIGSGKSSAAAMFRALGADTIDVDDISHELTAANGGALGAIESRFPGVVHHGILERAMLRERAFANPEQRRALEAILHPLIRAETQARLQSPKAMNSPYVMLVVPLLFESNAYADVIDCAVVVDVEESTQIKRVVATRDVPASTVEAIIASQMPRAERLSRAQFILDNRGDTANLQSQVSRLHSVFAASAAAKARRAALNEAAVSA
jgi:dephospho-CoA kinase